MFLGGGDTSEYDYFDNQFDPYFDDGEPHFMNRDSYDGYHQEQDDHFASQSTRFSLTDFFKNLLNLSRS